MKSKQYESQLAIHENRIPNFHDWSIKLGCQIEKRDFFLQKKKKKLLHKQVRLQFIQQFYVVLVAQKKNPPRSSYSLFLYLS